MQNEDSRLIFNGLKCDLIEQNVTGQPKHLKLRIARTRKTALQQLKSGKEKNTLKLFQVSIGHTQNFFSHLSSLFFFTLILLNSKYI